MSDSLRDTRPVSQRVVEAVAAKRGVGHTELEPLYYTVDPGSLDALFAPGVDTQSRPDLAFDYEGYRVEISRDGSVHLAPIEDAEPVTEPEPGEAGRGGRAIRPPATSESGPPHSPR